MKCFVMYKLPPFLPPPFFVTHECPGIYYRLGKKYNFDAFHTHNRFSPILNTVAIAKKKLKIPMIITIHNARPHNIDWMTDHLGGVYDDLLGKRFINSAEGLIAVSKYAFDVTCPKYPNFKQIIPNGIETKEFIPKKVDKEEIGLADKPMILFVGRILPQKGIKYLIEAYQILKKEIDIQLVIIGTGPELKKLKKMDKDVIFRGYVPEEDLIKHYQACDVFALPSVYEPFGMVLTEAMSCEKPVVASRTGGIPEIVDKSVGILTNPRDPHDLAKGIKKALTSKGKIMGKNGRKKCLDVFDWDIIAKKTEQFYTEFLANYKCE